MPTSSVGILWCLWQGSSESVSESSGSSIGCYCARDLLRSSVRLTSLGRRPGRRHERRGVGSLRGWRRGCDAPRAHDGLRYYGSRPRSDTGEADRQAWALYSVSRVRRCSGSPSIINDDHRAWTGLWSLVHRFSGNLPFVHWHHYERVRLDLYVRRYGARDEL